MRTQSNAWFFGASPRLATPNGISIDLDVFPEITTVTDGQTDGQTDRRQNSTGKNRPFTLQCSATRPTIAMQWCFIAKRPLLLCPHPMVGGIRWCCDLSVRLSVCLSVPFFDSSSSLFQTHSKGGSTVGYARIQTLSAGGISLRRAIPCLECILLSLTIFEKQTTFWDVR